MNEPERIERDTMGEIAVPSHAYYGAQTERARRNFAVGGGPLPAPLISALGLIKSNAARVHAELGLLDAELAESIARAADEVADNRLDAHFVVDVFQTGSGTSSNMNANEVIANRAGELRGAPLGSKLVHPNDHVNLGQSSNDVFPSAVQIGLATVVDRALLPQMRALADALHGHADRTFDQVKTGRTHLMDAMPIRHGQQVRGYAQQVERWQRRIEISLDELCELPLGGTAVGTGVNADPRAAAAICARLAKARGLPFRETTAHFQAQACVDVIVQMSGALRGFATAFYKLANDVRWMASGPQNGLAELQLPAVQPGSSIMPAKVNPVICESVLMLCAQVFANDGAVAFGNCQGQFELNTMLPMIARNVIEAATILGGGCAMFRERCVDGMQLTGVSAERVAKNPILATALNAAVGYETAARIAKQAAASDRTVREVASEVTKLGAAELEELLDARRLCGEVGRARTGEA